MAKTKPNPDVDENDVDSAEDEAGEDTIRLKVKTKIKKDALGDERVFEGFYEIPDTVDGCVEKFGEPIINSMIRASFRARLKGSIRPLLADGKTVEGKDGNKETEKYSDAEVQEHMDKYEPSLTKGRSGKSDSEKVLDAASKLKSKDEVANLLAQLQAQLEGME